MNIKHQTENETGNINMNIGKYKKGAREEHVQNKKEKNGQNDKMKHAIEK